MLFDKTFEELNKIIPNREVYNLSDIQIDDWSIKTENLLQHFEKDCNYLVDILDRKLTLKPFKNINIDYYYTSDIAGGINHAIFSFPINEFIIEFVLKIDLLVLPNLPITHTLALALYCRDTKECAAFKEMYLDHKRICDIFLNIIDRKGLFHKLHIDFENPFYNHPQYSPLTTRAKKYFIENYTLNPVEITLSCSMVVPNDDILFELFSSFIALFDSCYHYAVKRKSKDKLSEYYNQLVKQKIHL